MTFTNEQSEPLACALQVLLLAHGKPLSLPQLVDLFSEEQLTTAQIKQGLTALSAQLASTPLELNQVASGYRLQIRSGYAHFIERLWGERPQRYSRALLETLALIAYRQPTTRGEIEDVRGVAVNSHIIKTLQERDWIKVIGHKEVPGRPALLATTKTFLDDFSLSSLDQLPPLKEVRDLSSALTQFEDQRQAITQQATADTSEQHTDTEHERPARELSFSSLLAELDNMEKNLNVEFKDLPQTQDTLSEHVAQQQGTLDKKL